MSSDFVLPRDKDVEGKSAPPPVGRSAHSSMLDLRLLRQDKDALENELSKKYGKKFIVSQRTTDPMTPKEVVASIESLRGLIESHGKLIISLSYPYLSDTTQAQFYVILKQLSAVVRQGLYDTVLWEPKIWETAVAGGEAFMGETYERQDAPLKPTFWWHGLSRHFDEPPLTQTEDGWWTPDWEMHGLYLYPSERILGDNGEVKGRKPATGMFSFWFNSKPGPTLETLLPRVVFEPGMIYGSSIDGVFAQLVAAERFLKLPFIEITRACPLNHAERKPYKRERRPEPHITTIRLRRKEVHYEEAGEEGRNFTCHFLVGGLTGFWRKGKRFKSGRVGRPEYVHPYIKGDLSKPFKTPSNTVYIADR